MDASVRLALFELAGAVHMPRALPLFWKCLEVQGRLASLSSCFVPRFGRKKTLRRIEALVSDWISADSEPPRSSSHPVMPRFVDVSQHTWANDGWVSHLVKGLLM